jgi:sporulation protein YlmC with PRC-barrel domain
MSESIDIGLGLLDHQLIDSEGRRCGKVDDLEIEGMRGGNPVVTAILVGRRRQVHVPWERVQKVGSGVHLKGSARELRLGGGDDRMRRWLEWIPGA